MYTNTNRGVICFQILINPKEVMEERKNIKNEVLREHNESQWTWDKILVGHLKARIISSVIRLME